MFGRLEAQIQTLATKGPQIFDEMIFEKETFSLGTKHWAWDLGWVNFPKTPNNEEKIHRSIQGPG